VSRDKAKADAAVMRALSRIREVAHASSACAGDAREQDEDALFAIKRAVIKSAQDLVNGVPVVETIVELWCCAEMAIYAHARRCECMERRLEEIVSRSNEFAKEVAAHTAKGAKN
jgi:hypothetical protein